MSELSRLDERSLRPGWRRVKLGELSKDETSFADGPFGSSLKTEHYRSSGARVVRLQNIGAGTFLDADKAYIALDHYASLQRHSVEPGDIIVAALGNGARPAGRACLIPMDFGPGIVKADCFRVRLHANSVHGPYVVLALNSEQFLRQVADRMRGATRPRMTLDILRSCTIPLPPLPEQKRIAAMLNEQMASANALHAVAESLLDAARSLNDAFWERFFSSSRADSWPLRRINEVATGERAISDGPFGSHLKTEHYSREGARVVRLQNIGRGEFLNSDKAYVSLDHFSNLTRHAVQPNDIVVAALGDGARPAGRACLVPPDFGPGLVKADCFRIRLDASVALPEFVMAFLNSPRRLRSVNAAMRGATRPRVTLAMLRETRVPVPPLPEQIEAVSKLSAAFAQARSLTKMALETSRAISDLPAKLLAQAFSGAL